ncbi:hypothetical protein JG687_00015598 [Phytophthora cactorum]|uniref:Uncharacterized protein n=1 Tax=Phytophthora cactorum TaxID=29920 RepID=A0A8T1TUK0_9STRA|nr:hypothetical protein JG687_00015598 [Phytophthora cactorum]
MGILQKMRSSFYDLMLTNETKFWGIQVWIRVFLTSRRVSKTPMSCCSLNKLWRGCLFRPSKVRGELNTLLQNWRTHWGEAKEDQQTTISTF